MQDVTNNAQTGDWPSIRTVGYDGMLVSFGDTLSEPANRAALAFRAAVEQSDWSGLFESTTSLVSCFVRFDPQAWGHAALRADLAGLLATRDWYAAPLPDGRRLWRIPTVYGTDLAPQLEEAAQAAGLSPTEAIQSLSQAPVRVQTIGFAPGQPYLGELPACWDIPRQTSLTKRIPEGPWPWRSVRWCFFRFRLRQGGDMWGKLRSNCSGLTAPRLLCCAQGTR